jgi:hypothetical protein
MTTTIATTERKSSTLLRIYIAIALGIALTTLIVIFGFPDLFRNGRIFAEEGTHFWSYFLNSGSPGSISFPLYIHNGHFDLWTNIAAYLASKNPNNAANLFTWLALIPHMLTAFSMSNFALVQLGNPRKVEYFAAILATLALALNLLLGGIEVFVTTTNTQWVLCAYIFFTVCTQIIRQQTSKPSFLKNALLFCVNLAVMLSSFAGAILYPIQLACFAAAKIRRHNYTSFPSIFFQYLRENQGFTFGSLVQFISTVLFSKGSVAGRELDIIDASKGFFVQGLAGLLLPPGGPLEAMADLVKPNHSFFLISYIIPFSLLCITLLLFATHKKVPHLLTLFVTTFVFCQLALGDKSILISAGWGIRYFAPMRICICWILVSDVAAGLRNHVISLRTLSAVALAGVITGTMALHFKNRDQLVYFGLLPGKCQTETKRYFESIKINSTFFNSEQLIPICASSPVIIKPSKPTTSDAYR